MDRTALNRGSCTDSAFRAGRCTESFLNARGAFKRCMCGSRLRDWKVVAGRVIVGESGGGNGAWLSVAIKSQEREKKPE